MNIVEKRNVFLISSAVVVLASLLILLTQGLNLGIDFRGGTLLERGIPGEVSVQQVRDVLSSPELAEYDLAGSSVQPLEESTPGQSVMLIRTPALDDSDGIAAIDEALSSTFGEVEVRRSELVGPVIGQELVRQALWALALAGLGIVAYVSIRFEYRFGVAALIAVLHDVLITLGVLSLLGSEINTPFVAAILTVVGYSINDTIVVFDRIRENLSHRRRESLGELVNTSIRQTIIRSINTSSTTLLVLLSLYFLGGSTIKDFSLTLLIGVAVGTYSSIFLASPIWYLWRQGGERRVGKTA